MIYLDPSDNKELLTIIEPYKKYDIRAYGSRVKGTHHQFSDLDLCVMHDMPWSELDQLREKLENSDIGIFITVTQWSALSNDFKTLIEKDLIALQKQETLYYDDISDTYT